MTESAREVPAPFAEIGWLSYIPIGVVSDVVTR